MRSLRITKETILEEQTTEYKDKISIALVEQNNGQIGLSKNMVPNLGWFDRNKTKFKDWWKGIRLFLKSNRVIEIEIDNRITAILAYLRESIVGIYA